MSDVVVLDCPFCGAAAKLVPGMSNGVVRPYLVQCSNCPAEMLGINAGYVLAAWNRREVVGGKPEAPGT